MRAEAGGPALDVAAEPCLELTGRRRLGVVREPGVEQPELVRAGGEALGELGERLATSRHEARAEVCHGGRPRRQGRHIRQAELDAA